MRAAKEQAAAYAHMDDIEAGRSRPTKGGGAGKAPPPSKVVKGVFGKQAKPAPAPPEPEDTIDWREATAIFERANDLRWGAA